MPTSDWLAKYYIVWDSSMPPLSNGLRDYFHQACAFSKHLGFLHHRDPKLGENINIRLYHFIKREFKSCKNHLMYTLHMYMMSRYADLSGKLDEILKEVWKKSFLEGFCFLTFSWYVVGGSKGTRVSEYPLTL